MKNVSAICAIASTAMLATAACRSNKEISLSQSAARDSIAAVHLSDSIAFDSRHIFAGEIEIDSPLIIVTRSPEDKPGLTMVTIGGRRLRAVLNDNETTVLTVTGEYSDSAATKNVTSESAHTETRGNSRLPYILTAAGTALLLALTALSWRERRPRL